MKLIIRAPNWVGDAVMALPAVSAASAAPGVASTTIMARASVAPLFQSLFGIDYVIEIENGHTTLTRSFRIAGRIRDEHYDLGLILPDSFSSALIFRLGGVKQRIGYAAEGRSLLLTRAVKSPRGKMHRVERYCNLVETVLGQKVSDRMPRLEISPSDLRAAEALLDQCDLNYAAPYMAIAPQAVAPSRRWGIENYAALAGRIISEMRLPVLLVGSKDDSAVAEIVRNGRSGVFNLCGRTSLLQAAAILSGARLFVGNDSGLAHLAAASGCPVVVLSGADDPAETSPVSDRKQVIIKEIDCISCVRNICPEKGDRFMRCMRLITVEEVFDAVKRVGAI